MLKVSTPTQKVNSPLNCRFCHSINIGVFKAVHEGKNGKTFHQGYKCFQCKKVVYVERNKQLYELTKNIPWSHKKDWNYGNPSGESLNFGDQVPDNLLSPGD